MNKLFLIPEILGIVLSAIAHTLGYLLIIIIFISFVRGGCVSGHINKTQFSYGSCDVSKVVK